MVQTTSPENDNLLYHVPTVRLIHAVGNIASGRLRNQGEIGRLAHEVIHASCIRQGVEDGIGYASIAAIGAVVGYAGAIAVLKK